MKFVEPFYLAQEIGRNINEVKDAIGALKFKPAVVSRAMGRELYGYTERQKKAIVRLIKTGKKTRVPSEGPWLEASDVANICGYGIGGYITQIAKRRGVPMDIFMIGPTAKRCYFTEKTAGQLDQCLDHYAVNGKIRKGRRKNGRI